MKTLFITKCKRNERCESRGTSKTSKSYYTFALTQDLLHKSHVTRNLSLTTHLLKIFRARWYIFAVLLLDDFSLNISSDSDPFIFRLTWRRDPFIMVCVGMMVWVKLRKKDYEHVWILWRVAHFVSIILISSPDQNFSAGIRRVSKSGLYLIVLFNDTFIFFLFYLWLDR